MFCISHRFFFPPSLILLWVHEMDARVGFFFLFLLVSTLDVLNTRFFSFFSAFIICISHCLILSFEHFLYHFSCLV